MIVIARMCGGRIGPRRGGKLLRRIPRGAVSDWFGIGIWRK